MSFAQHLCVILPAAGSGSRLGGAIPKVEFSLGGKPVFAHALETFLGFPQVAQVIITVPPVRLARFAHDHRAVAALHDKRVQLVAGSTVERYDTILLALAQVAPAITHIAVHDAARPLVSKELIARCLEATKTPDAVLPALPVADTLRRGAPDATLGALVPRTNLLAVQTPQIFERKLLQRAYENLAQLDAKTITDDAGLVEALGEPVFAVMGDPRNLKLTRQADWEMLQALEVGARMLGKGFKGMAKCG